jgi:hypothetical protein
MGQEGAQGGRTRPHTAYHGWMVVRSLDRREAPRAPWGVPLCLICQMAV